MNRLGEKRLVGSLEGRSVGRSVPQRFSAMESFVQSVMVFAAGGGGSLYCRDGVDYIGKEGRGESESTVYTMSRYPVIIHQAFSVFDSIQPSALLVRSKFMGARRRNLSYQSNA